MADTDSESMKFTIVAELGNCVAQAVMPTVTATIFVTCGAGGDIQFVVGDEYGFWWNFVKVSECGDSLPAAIHERSGNK